MTLISQPIGFIRADEFRAWLRKHHAKHTELLVRLYKTHAADKGVTYKQALDEALCFGWIDGVRRSFDRDSFVQRFSPRKEKSKWSVVNVRHFKRLTAEGRVEAPGLAAFRARDQKAKPYSFESRPLELDRASSAKFRANKRAWAHFTAQPPWYQRTSKFLVMSAKRPETRQRRLKVLIGCSARGKLIPPLDR